MPGNSLWKDARLWLAGRLLLKWIRLSRTEARLALARRRLSRKPERLAGCELRIRARPRLTGLLLWIPGLAGYGIRRIHA